MFLYCLYVLIDAIYTFFVAFCLCILNIYGRLVRLVRCNVSTDRLGLGLLARPLNNAIHYITLHAEIHNGTYSALSLTLTITLTLLTLTVTTLLTLILGTIVNMVP